MFILPFTYRNPNLATCYFTLLQLAEKMDMLTRRLSKLERDSEERQELNTAFQAQSTDAVAIDPFHPDVSVIAFNFKNTDSGDIHEAMNKLIKDGLKLGNINVVRIEQLPGRDGKPGGIKIQLPNKNAKIEVHARCEN